MKKLIPWTFLFCAALTAGCYEPPSSTGARNAPLEIRPGTAANIVVVTTTPSPGVTPVAGVSDVLAEAVAEYNAKRYDAAERLLTPLFASDPNNSNVRFYLGKIYFERKSYEAALTHFEQAAKLDSKSVDKLMALGETQRELKQYDRAVVQYQKVIGFAPENANAYYALGLTYLGLDNKIAARQQLRVLEPLNKTLAESLAKAIDAAK